MKKLLIGFFGIFLLLGGILFSLPFLFGDQIKAKIKQLANDQITAQLDFKDIRLSLFRDFPQLNVAFDQVRIVGEDDFAEDTLLVAKELSLSLNLMSLFGSDIQIYGMGLRQGEVFVKILPDGRANYDIYAAPADTAYDDPLAETTEPLQINIDHWEIQQTNITYLDYTLGLAARLQNLQHTGSGNIKSDTYDLRTETQIEALSVHYDKTDYFDQVPVAAQMTLHIDNRTATYTFKENRCTIRELPLQFVGQVVMPNEDIEIDLTFAAPQNTFKNLLSLIPPSYLKDYQGLKTEGNFTLSGIVKGTYNEKQMPGFDIQLQVNQGRIQYPGLPAAISDIALDMRIQNTSGQLEQTITDIKNFKLLMGRHPVSGQMHIKGLDSYRIKGNINAQLDLADVPSFYPLEEITQLEGDFQLQLQLDGIYDDAKALMPAFTAQMQLRNGLVRNKDYPDLPLEQINLRAQAINKTGNQADTQIDFDPLSFSLEGKPFTMRGQIINPDAPTYSLTAQGSLDLEKILHIFPQEGIQATGILTADIQTKGSMAAIDAEDYAALPTSGTMQLRNFDFTSADLPQGMRIDQMNLRFTPRLLQLEDFKGRIGNSDLQLKGTLTNYLAYGLGKDGAVLAGTLDLYSRSFDANQWLTEETEAETPTDSSNTEVIALPADVYFRFASKMDTIYYDNLTLRNATGIITLQDGILSLNNLKFQTLGGQFVTNGTYDPRDTKKPQFDFGLNILGLSIQESVQQFSSVQAFAPIAQALVGRIGTELRIKGQLQPDFSPRLETLTGLGSFLLKDAKFASSRPEIVNALGEFTGLGSSLAGNAFKDVQMKTQFENGLLTLDPVNFRLADYPAMLSGTSGLDGRLDLKLDLKLPKQVVAGQLQNWFGVGADALSTDQIDLHLNITGTHTSPRIGLDKAATQADLQRILKATARDQAQQFLQKLIDPKTDTARSDSTTRPTLPITSPDSLKQQLRDSLRLDPENPIEDAKDKVEDLKETLKKWGIGRKKGD